MTSGRFVSRSRSQSVRARPANRTIIAAPAVGLGSSAVTKLKMTFFKLVTTAATGVFTGYISPGSCFNPGGDLNSLQAPTFDQWKLLYSRYLVKSAVVRIKAEYLDPNYASNVGGVVAAFPSAYSTAMSTFQNAASQPYAKVEYIPDGKWITFKLDHKQVLGLAQPLSSVTNGALCTANPITVQSMQLPIFVGAYNAVVQPYILNVEIIQTVHFDERIQIADTP